MNTKFSLKKLLSNKKFTISFSIIAAFVIWLSIVINQTPTINKEITNIPITINTSGTVSGELGLDAVSGDLSRMATVMVSGEAYSVYNLTSNDIQVTASLSSVTAPGRYELDLVAKRVNGGDYDVLSVSPSSISVTFDYIDTKEFTIIPKVTGVSAVNGLVAQEAIVSDSSQSIISVRGPRSQMDKLSTVMALVTANEQLSTTKTYDAQIELLDSDGEILNNELYTLPFTTVKVSVPISKVITVPILPPTFANSNISVSTDLIEYSMSESVVTIIGPEETINTITGVELENIDIFNLSPDNYVFDVPLALPDGVKTVDNSTTVTVTVNMSGYTVRTFTVPKDNLITINRPNDCNILLQSAIKNVRVCGPRSIIESLRDEDIFAQVDLKGKSVGDYTVPIVIKSNKTGGVWQLGTYEGRVHISSDSTEN